MSYVKTTWATGDVVTAEKLNNIESGIESVDGGKENSSNKVTTISGSSTDTQYPSAKAVYTAISSAIADVDELIGSGVI